MTGFGWQEVVIILVIVLLVFFQLSPLPLL